MDYLNLFYCTTFEKWKRIQLNHNISLYILTIVNYVTSFYYKKYLKNSEAVARSFLKNIFSHRRLPDALLSDHGFEFTPKFWKGLFTICEVKMEMPSMRHLYADGSSELISRVVDHYIQCFCEHTRKYSDIFLQFLYLRIIQLFQKILVQNLCRWALWKATRSIGHYL